MSILSQVHSNKHQATGETVSRSTNEGDSRQTAVIDEFSKSLEQQNSMKAPSRPLSENRQVIHGAKDLKTASSQVHVDKVFTDFPPDETPFFWMIVAPPQQNKDQQIKRSSAPSLTRQSHEKNNLISRNDSAIDKDATKSSS